MAAEMGMYGRAMQQEIIREEIIAMEMNAGMGGYGGDYY